MNEIISFFERLSAIGFPPSVVFALLVGYVFIKKPRLFKIVFGLNGNAFVSRSDCHESMDKLVDKMNASENNIRAEIRDGFVYVNERIDRMLDRK